MLEERKQDYTIIPIEPTLPLSTVHAPQQPIIIEAEWVRHYKARRRGQWLKWLGLLFRLSAAGALTWFFYIIPPDVFPDPFENWKNPVIIFLLVCYIGKTLLDTFFYDHYQP